MSSSWYKEFQNNLAAASTRSKSVRGFKDIAMIAPTVNTSAFKKNPNGLGEHLLDWGGRALDILSRPGYTTGGFLNTQLENDLNDPSEADKDPWEAAWRGFTGKDKEFFKPASILNPHEKGEDFSETAGRFTEDLVAGMAADPTSYIGVGLVTGLLNKLGLGAAKEALHGAAAARNTPKLLDAGAEQAADLATDVERLKGPVGDLTSTNPLIDRILGEQKLNTATPEVGVDKTFIPNMPVMSVNDTAGLSGQDLIKRLLDEPTLKKNIVGALDSPVAQQGVEKVAKNLKFSTGTPENDLAMLTLLRADIAKNLRETRGRLYKKGEMDSPWEDKLITDAVHRPEPREFSEIERPVGKTIPGEEIPGTPIETQANRDATLRFLWESSPEASSAAKAKALSKKRDGYVTHDSDVYYAGAKVGEGFAAFKAHADETFDFSGLDNTINQTPSSVELPNGTTLTYGQLASAFKQGEPKPFLNGVGIPVGEDIVDFNEYLGSRFKTYGERSKSRKGEDVVQEPSKRQLQAYEKAVASQKAERDAYEAANKAADEYVPEWQSVRPDAQSRREWINKHRDKLTPKETKQLNEALYRGSEKQFNKLVDNIMEREASLDLDVIDDFNQAVADGRISKEVAKEVWAKFGATNAKQARDRIASIDNRIAKTKNKLAEKISATQTEAYDNVVPKSRAQAVRWAEQNPLPTPKTPRKFFDQNFTIKRETFDSSPMRQFVDAVSDIVPAETLGKLTPKNAELLMSSIKSALKDTYLHNRKPLPGVTNRMRTNTNNDVYNTFREFNEHKQYSLWKSLIPQITKDLPADVKGAERAGIVYDQAMPVLKAYDDILRAYGIHPSITAGGKGLPVSLHDVLSSLPRAQAEKFFFNKAAEITPSQWLHIAEEAYYFKLDDVRDIVKLDLSGNPEALSFEGNARYVGARAKANTAKRQAKQGKFGANFDSEQVYREAGVTKKTFEGNVERIITPEFVRKIKDTVAINSRRADIQAGEFVKSTTNQMVEKFVQDMDKLHTQDELFDLVKNSTKGVPGFVSQQNIVAPVGAVEAVTDQMKLVSRGNPGTEIALRERDANLNANTLDDLKTSGQNMVKASDDRVKMVEGIDFSKDLALSGVGTAIHHMFPHIQEQQFRHMLLNVNNIVAEEAKQFTQSLSTFEREFGFDQVQTFWNDIRNGVLPSGPREAPYARMEMMISRVFDDMRRAGVTPEAFNTAGARYQLHYKLEGRNFDEAFKSWKEWDAEDPLNVLSRAHAASRMAMRRKEMFDNISETYGSRTQQKGYVRIFASSGRSKVTHMIDTRLYYPKDVAENLQFLDRTMRELDKPASQNKLLKVFDETTHRLKSGLTIYRPGHHVRNAMGDAWLNFMAGVDNPIWYKRAAEAIKTRSDHYSDELLQSIRLEDYAPTGRSVATATVNGKRVQIDAGMAYILARDSGGLPVYSSLEDLGVASTWGMAEKVEGKVTLGSPTGGRAHKVASNVSEVRDHYFRLAQFIKEMNGSSIKVARREGESIEAATQRALMERAQTVTANVRKWHPDGTDLQRFERNGLKRGILFYSWIRKMIPLVIEASVMKPGRTLAFPKATYTFAEAQGIDLNGFTDPFPANQLFPAWMGGMQGPQFGNSTYGYIGMRTGNPLLDIMDQYFASPGQSFKTIVGATHPLVKMPYELATGTTTQGVPINDLGKYAIGQVPFGSLVNTLAGKPVGGTSTSDEGYDPGGIRDPKAMALFNTLTGLGLIDMSKPSYVKTGEFDLKYGRTEAP